MTEIPNRPVFAAQSGGWLRLMEEEPLDRNLLLA